MPPDGGGSGPTINTATDCVGLVLIGGSQRLESNDNSFRAHEKVSRQSASPTHLCSVPRREARKLVQRIAHARSSPSRREGCCESNFFRNADMRLSVIPAGLAIGIRKKGDRLAHDRL